MYINSLNSLIATTKIANTSSINNTDLNSESYDEMPINNDTFELSLNYSEQVLSILDNIKNAFSKRWFDLENGSSISDFTEGYGSILHDITSNPLIDNNQMENLTKILDSSFDDFANNLAENLARNISSFFNLSYNLAQSYTAQGTDMGISGESIINKDEFMKNIYNLLSASKIFYKTNINGTKDEFELFLIDIFSVTQNINKLSYKDFNALRNTLSAYYKTDSDDHFSHQFSDPSRKLELLNTALSNLRFYNASQLLVSAFEKAKQQNGTYFIRIDAYRNIRMAYETRIDQLSKDYIKNESKLDSLKEFREEMIKEHKKEMQKLKEILRKQMMQSILLGLSDGHEQIEKLQKLHENQLNYLSEQKIAIGEKLKSIGEEMKKQSEEFKKFMKSPASFIDRYLNKEDSYHQDLEGKNENSNFTDESKV